MADCLPPAARTKPFAFGMSPVSRSLGNQNSALVARKSSLSWPLERHRDCFDLNAFEVSILASASSAPPRGQFPHVASFQLVSHHEPRQTSLGLSKGVGGPRVASGHYR